LIESVRPLLAIQPFLYGHHLPGARADALVQAALIRLAAEDEDNLIVRSEQGRLTGLAVMRPLSWDTEFFGMGCARVEAFYFDRTDESALGWSLSLAAGVTDWCRRRQVRFVSAKIEAADALAAMGLGRAGFDVVDNEVTLVINSLPPPPPLPDGFQVVSGDCLAEVPVEALGRLFEHSRFHADPRIDNDLADRLWQMAVTNQAAQEGRPVTFLMDGPRPVGIISCRSEDQLASVIGLDVGDWFIVGVAEEYRGRGLGRVLLSVGLKECLTRYGLIQVATQTYNLPALGLYQAGGFKVRRAGLSLHCFVED
jgi:GNAT superfamily N-acetyltransferase